MVKQIPTFSLKTIAFAILFSSYAYGEMLEGYDPAMTAYFSLHFNRKQVIEIGCSVTPGLVVERKFQPNHYIGYVDIGILNRIGIGINGVEYGLGLATGSPMVGLGLYGAIAYAWNDNGNTKKYYRWFFPEKGLYLGYGITGSFIANVSYERLILVRDTQTSFGSFAFGIGW